MDSRTQLRVLFFDVFGTCVAQLPPIADALSKAAKEALESDRSDVDPSVRSKAADMTHEQWFDFGIEWNKHENALVSDMKAKNHVDWRAVDEARFQSLYELLANRGLVILRKDGGSLKFRAAEGSLWNDSQLKELGLVWHRLPPWPDTCRGLELLNKKFATVTLSNTYNELMEGLVAHSNIPFQHVYTSDLFKSFKPNPKVYLGAAEKMGVKPEECGLVAAHLFDLKGAKECGFYTIYVDRPLEEKNPELREENIPDVRVEMNENGFITVAERLGIESI